MCNNRPTPYLVNINAYTKLDKFFKSIPKILNRITILTSIKGHDSVKN